MEDNLKAGIVYSVLGIVAIVLYLIYYYAALANAKVTLKNTYYKLNFCLGTVGFYHILVHLVYTCPVTLTQRQIYGSLAGDILAFTQGLAFFNSLSLILLIAFDRFCVIAQKWEFLFQNKRIYMMIAATWLYAAPMTGFVYGMGCKKHFFETLFFMGNQCPSVDMLTSIGNGTVAANFSIVGLIAVLYLLTYVFLRKRGKVIAHTEAKRRRQISERNLMIQALIQGVTLAVDVVTFSLFPRIFDAFTARILSQVFGLILFCMDPLLFLCFNKEAQSNLLRIMKRTSTAPVISIGSNTQKTDRV